MRQNTAVLGITCFIEASSVALRERQREREREKKWGKKEDPQELVEASTKKKKQENAALDANFAVPLLPGLMKHQQSMQQDEEKWASYTGKY